MEEEKVTLPDTEVYENNPSRLSSFVRPDGRGRPIPHQPTVAGSTDLFSFPESQKFAGLPDQILLCSIAR
jgi:hypothetical protein